MKNHRLGRWVPFSLSRRLYEQPQQGDDHRKARARSRAGKPVCSLNVATDEGYTNDRGEKVDKTEWHKVVFWDRQQYLAKRSLVFVEGKLSTRNYQDKQGQGRYVTEIQGQRASSFSTARGTATGSRADKEADARHRGGTPRTMKTSAPRSLPKPPASMTCLFRQNQ